LSFDFFEHATAYLVSGLFEVHDRTRFEIIALSYGPDDRSPARARLKRAVEDFIDVRTHTDAEIAALMRRRGVQIAVDLKGHTGGARTGILAQRAAPIQVNYLGYPGTLGAEYIDYLIADSRLIPESARADYSEQIIYMPHSYQPNDPHRPRPATTEGRAAYGLPQAGFVFGCFNNLYKITPAVYDVWMTLLTQIPDSVLWLLGGNELAMANLQRAAAARGVSPHRVLFARPVPLEDHLRRYHHVDLFLDTSPCNAHTTASDALWMGVPLVTVTGSTFAGRVATSLLYAVGLPQLALPDLPSYAQAALRIAADPDELAGVKRRLDRVRTTCPLFDVARYCQHLESAYRAIWEAHLAGRRPHCLHVPPVGPPEEAPTVPPVEAPTVPSHEAPDAATLATS
jgi:predicted O-linked N-acetylglucosamine transferase (SPINDLY family)